MLNSSFILKRIEPYLNLNRELSEFEFTLLFSNLTKKEQYEVINIMIANDIYYVDEKKEETKELKHLEILNKAAMKHIDFKYLENLKNEQLCVMYQNGDKAALAALIDKNKRFIYKYALRGLKQFSRTNLTEEDLYQEGVLGLIKAADRFDPEKEYAFLTYCGCWIKQSIARNAVDNGFLIRLPVHIYEKIQKINIYRKKYPCANEEQLIEKLQEDSAFSPPITREQLCEYRKYEEFYLDTTSLNILVGEDGENELIDFIPDNRSTTIDQQITEDILHENIMQILDTLEPREEEVIKLRFGLSGEPPMTLEAVGDRFKLTRERIRQIENNALQKLRHPSRSKKIKDFLD